MKNNPGQSANPHGSRNLERRYEILGVYFVLLGILLFLSLVLREPGIVGEVTREALWAVFGKTGCYVLPVALISMGWHFFRWCRRFVLSQRIIALILFSLVFLCSLSFLDPPGNMSRQAGLIGDRVTAFGVRYLSRPGFVTATIALLLTATILMLEKPLHTVLTAIPGLVRNVARGYRRPSPSPKTAKPGNAVLAEPAAAAADGRHIIQQLSEHGETFPVRTTSQSSGRAGSDTNPNAPSRTPATRREMSSSARLAGSSGKYVMPDLSMLDPNLVRPRKPGKIASQARQLEETLASFGISARVIEIHSGPAVTRYDLQPAPGVKVSRIANLADDLSLALAARGLRIEAPIPGKAAVGIEVPNSEVSTVTMREVLESPEFRDSSHRLRIALGKDIAGATVVTDLPKLPHLLIAGATGSGKSVCINTILASILYSLTPEEVRLILIDPKRVELAVYNNIPHLLSPVVTEPKKAAAVLKCVVVEMEQRYKAFAEVGARDLERFNASVGTDLRKPSMVVIIDELADLMMVAPSEVEDSICRLAQMARATGIHLIVATQRPSVDVITGLIKANIPSRIAFAVSSQIDSRTILDSAGAEKLLGRGDMLFSPVGALKPLRIQGAFIADHETENLVKFWKGQGIPDFDETLVNAETEGPAINEDSDDLFFDAVRIVVDMGQASASLLQRKLRIGYSRAGRLIDMMEARGIVGRADGSRAREVLITGRQLEELINRHK